MQADWSKAWKSIVLTFHGDATTFDINTSIKANPNQTRKAFYIRSAYRHEPDFTTNGLKGAEDILLNSNRASRMILGEARVSENYQRMVAESLLALYDPEQKQKTAGEITEQIMGEVRAAMNAVFDDLALDGQGNPMSGGTFRFTKGNASEFHYKNLSGGEKAAFDLLLDFVVKKHAFNDTVYCIDEPELHMHTRLQARLLDQLFKLVPENCQLWISTHSIGMARMASELYAKNPAEVAFLDFHDYDFDNPVMIKPIQPNRRYWKNMFATALDDLADLIVPANIILCEGKRLGDGGRKPSFDVTVYRCIFGDDYPEIEFLPLGGTSQVMSDGAVFTNLLASVANGSRVWSVFDKDDRAPHEIENLAKQRVQVLGRRDLESYLWDEEIIKTLCEKHAKPEIAQEIIAEKQRLLADNPTHGKPLDDVKAVSGPLFNFTKKKLNLTGCGNDAEAFGVATLAPLLVRGQAIYEELATTILNPLLPKL